jgi:hypothetical protein
MATHLYEVRPGKDNCGVDLISDALPFGHLWYGEPNTVSNAIGYAEHRSRLHDAVICIYDTTAEPFFPKPLFPCLLCCAAR